MVRLNGLDDDETLMLGLSAACLNMSLIVLSCSILHMWPELTLIGLLIVDKGSKQVALMHYMSCSNTPKAGRIQGKDARV